LCGTRVTANRHHFDFLQNIDANIKIDASILTGLMTLEKCFPGISRPLKDSAQLLQRLHLDLPDTLASNTELFAYIFQRCSLVTMQSKAPHHNFAMFTLELHKPVVDLLVNTLVLKLPGRVWIVVIWNNVQQRPVAVRPKSHVY